MQQWVAVWFQWVHDWGYVGIVMLMAMESSVIPIPSEIVIPPAAYWAAQGRYSFGGVVLAGTAGRLLGDRPDLLNDVAVLVQVLGERSWLFGGFAIVLCALYVLVMRLTAPPRP